MPTVPRTRGLEARRGPNLAQKGCDRGLAVRAGDGGDGLGLHGVEAGGKVGERLSRVGRAEERDARCVRLGAVGGQNRNGAARQGFAHKSHTVRLRSRKRDEQHARRNQSAIGRNASNSRIQASTGTDRKRNILD